MAIERKFNKTAYPKIFSHKKFLRFAINYGYIRYYLYYNLNDIFELCEVHLKRLMWDILKQKKVS